MSDLDLSEQQIDAQLEADTVLTPGKPRKVRKKKTEPEPESVAVNWAFLSEATYPMVEPFYAQHGLSLDKSVFAACIGAWGRVLNKWLPYLSGYEEESTAILLTLGLGAPLLQAVLKSRKTADAGKGGGNGQPSTG